MINKIVMREQYSEEDINNILHEICDREHSSCNEDCPVYGLQTEAERDTKDCHQFKNGQKMKDYIREAKGFDSSALAAHRRRTINEARVHIDEHIYGKGCICWCCQQKVKVNESPIYSSSIRLLMASFFKFGIDTPFHAERYSKQLKYTHPHYFAGLRHWGLIDWAPKTDAAEDDRKKTSGRWIVTEKGADFVQGKIRIPKTIQTYNAKLLGYVDSLDTVDVKEALGNKFDYRELLLHYRGQQ